MSFVKCFDVVEMVIEDAKVEFGAGFAVDEEKLDILHEYCDAIDTLSKKFDGVSYEAEIDRDTKEVLISLECEEIIVEEAQHRLYQLFDRAVRVTMSPCTDDTMIVKFVFPSILTNA